MSGIVLSASVRQNLLSLQSTASLLATTQNDLATGNKVNSALDNPTNFFTAQSLNNRASDINNLLDGIGNGVQVLQAANTGITSLQSLISSAQSIANQALQTPVGYSTLSNVSTTIAGATATNLLGTTTYTSTSAASNILYNGTAGGTTAASSTTTLGGSQGVDTGTIVTNTSSAAASTTASTFIESASGTANALSSTSATKFADGDVFTINGKTVTIRAASTPTSASLSSGSSTLVSGTNDVTDGNGNTTVYLTADTTKISDLLTAFDLASGVQKIGTITTGAATAAAVNGQTLSSVNGSGNVVLESTTGQDLTITGKADDLKALGLTAAAGSGNATVQAFRATGGSSLGTLVQAGSTLNVDGKVITFTDAYKPATSAVATGSGETGNVVTDGSGNSTVYLQGGTIADVLTAIDLATGVQTASNSAAGVATLSTTSGLINSTINGTTISGAGALKISTGVNADLAISGTGNALAALGLAGNTGTGTAFSAARTAGAGTISGKTLTFSAFNSGTAVSVTFGNGTNQVNTLAQLNTALQANNLNATLNANGLLTISAANNYASSTIGSAAVGGVIGGTLPNSLSFSTASAPVADASAQSTRASLVTQYNNVLQQIDTTAQDSSFNGVNLLNGDQLKLVFNETDSSTLNITGVTFNSAGLGLSSLVAGTDFIDNNATNNVLTSLTASSNTLRSEASSLGSNLSIVQIRQDFSKNLINVLQTGSSNLTLADTNEEAANSQALSTRQSIAVSALALANTSQQSVLQLLR
jgi:flagellin-like hook-associated protein FlgL